MTVSEPIIKEINDFPSDSSNFSSTHYVDEELPSRTLEIAKQCKTVFSDIFDFENYENEEDDSYDNDRVENPKGQKIKYLWVLKLEM